MDPHAMTNQHERDEQRNPFSCSECGSPLMQTSEHHSCCPNGHGGLRGPLPKKIRQLNHAILAGCPVATVDRSDTSVWMIDGRKHKRVRIYTRKVDGLPRVQPGFVVAIADGDVVLFEISDEELNQ